LPESPDPRSIHEMAPLETGGVIARKGFAFQDHVAVGFCLQMLGDSGLQEVWCENQDDITLLWETGKTQNVEFVQVKSAELDQLWSVSKLCCREDGRTGTSILEKSLAYDRPMQEDRYFRIVTARDVKSELAILKMPLDNAYRRSSCQEITEIAEKAGRFLPGCISPAGNDYGYWLRRALWDVRHDLDSVHTRNLHHLKRISETYDEFLMSDQIEEIYTELLARVSDAARSEWKLAPEKKKILKVALSDWLAGAIQGSVHPAAKGTGKTLEAKMIAAGIPGDYIDTAKEMKRAYRAETLNRKYLSTSDIKSIECEVAAKMNELKSALDAGTYDDTGIEFHNRCLDALKQLRSEAPTAAKPNLSFLQGCMYNIADRCPHRFRRLAS